MVDGETRSGVPAWYWAIAVGALLFEGAGAFLLANSLTLDPATLPLDQRAVYEATPQWMTIAWVVAISAGLAGAIGLLLRRLHIARTRCARSPALWSDRRSFATRRCTAGSSPIMALKLRLSTVFPRRASGSRLGSVRRAPAAE